MHYISFNNIINRVSEINASHRPTNLTLYSSQPIKWSKQSFLPISRYISYNQFIILHLLYLLLFYLLFCLLYHFIFVTGPGRIIKLILVANTITEALDLHFDVHLFWQAATVIGSTESRDLFRPITVVACKNKWRSNYKSKGSIGNMFIVHDQHLHANVNIVNVNYQFITR